MYYVGLDLHKKYITGCVLDSQGPVVAEQRRLPPVLETLLGWLAPLGQPVAVALEATLYWAWLHDRLTAAGYQVAVAHPQQVKLICHARCKTDPVDARKLADLLRTDLLPAIWIPDAATRARRTLLRGRAWVVRTRTRVKARIQAYLAAENERVPVSDLFSRGGRAWLATVALPPEVRQQVDRLVALVAHLDAQIAEQDRGVRELAQAILPRPRCCRRFRGSGRLGRSCCSPRSERSPGLVRVTSWRRMRGWCRARGARAGRPHMGRSAPRGVRGSSGCWSKRCRR